MNDNQKEDIGAIRNLALKLIKMKLEQIEKYANNGNSLTRGQILKEVEYKILFPEILITIQGNEEEEEK